MAELFSSTPYAALTARERIWVAIREMKTVTVREVADRCDAKADAVRGYFTGLPPGNGRKAQRLHAQARSRRPCAARQERRDVPARFRPFPVVERHADFRDLYRP